MKRSGIYVTCHKLAFVRGHVLASACVPARRAWLLFVGQPWGGSLSLGLSTMQVASGCCTCGARACSSCSSCSSCVGAHLGVLLSAPWCRERRRGGAPYICHTEDMESAIVLVCAVDSKWSNPLPPNHSLVPGAIGPE